MKLSDIWMVNMHDSGHSGTSGLHVEEVVLDIGSTIVYIIAHCMNNSLAQDIPSNWLPLGQTHVLTPFMTAHSPIPQSNPQD